MTSSVPDTRNSLILRLPDNCDVEAWDQFVAIYEPLIYRLARAKGFQDADAHEIVQEVLLAVSRAVQRWRPDAERGRFRDWLFRIARNLMINYFTRRKYQPLGTGDSGIVALLMQQAEPASDDSQTINLEYQREVFRWAADQVRNQVKQSTWKAFWLTSVEGVAVVEAAKELKLSVGAVHIARSRVLGRLRDIADGLVSSDRESEVNG